MDLRELAKGTLQTLVPELGVFSPTVHQINRAEQTILHALETAVGERDETIEAGCLAVQQQQELISEQINQLTDLRARLEQARKDGEQLKLQLHDAIRRRVA